MLLVELTQCYIMLGTAGFDNWERRTWWERSLHGTVDESKAQDGQEDLCFFTAHAEEAAYSAGLSTGYQRELLRNREGKKCAHIGPRIVNVGRGGHTVCVEFVALLYLILSKITKISGFWKIVISTAWPQIRKHSLPLVEIL